TATAYRVTGMPARPDEAGGMLAQASVTADVNGFFNSTLPFSSVVAMPAHAPFAVVVNFTGGSCTGMSWPISNWYPQGSGWIADGARVVLSTTAIDRSDVPIATMSVPDSGLWFSAHWRSMPASAKLDDGRILIIGNDAQPEIFT